MGGMRDIARCVPSAAQRLGTWPPTVLMLHGHKWLPCAMRGQPQPAPSKVSRRGKGEVPSTGGSPQPDQVFRGAYCKI